MISSWPSASHERHRRYIRRLIRVCIAISVVVNVVALVVEGVSVALNWTRGIGLLSGGQSGLLLSMAGLLCGLLVLLKTRPHLIGHRPD